MSNLQQIEQRHSSDRLRDVLFILAVAIVTAVAIGSTTSLSVGKSGDDWSLSVIEGPIEIAH